MNDLRKCPFCGCDARVEMTGTTIENGEEYDDYTVVCTNKECLCFLGVGLFRSKEAAIEAWNRRIEPPAQPEIIRCKDCEHADKYCHCSYTTWWNNPDDFCSRPKRREE